MKSDVPMFTYKPLEFPDSIRLIELLPGPSTTLTCNVIDVRMSDSPHYEALSYAWGPPVCTDVLAVPASGAIINITRNLANALQALRLHSMGIARTLWVDAM